MATEKEITQRKIIEEKRKVTKEFIGDNSKEETTTKLKCNNLSFTLRSLFSFIRAINIFLKCKICIK